MPSDLDIAKRELVKLLRELAAKYRVSFSLTRESSNKDVTQAFKKVSLKVHPDKGGDVAFMEAPEEDLCSEGQGPTKTKYKEVRAHLPRGDRKQSRDCLKSSI